MYSVHHAVIVYVCTVYSGHCTVTIDTGHCTVYSGHCTVTIDTGHCTVDTGHCTVIIDTGHCAVYSASKAKLKTL